MATRTLQDIQLDITRITADLADTPEGHAETRQALAGLWREVAQVADGGGAERSLLRLAARLLADTYSWE